MIRWDRLHPQSLRQTYSRSSAWRDAQQPIAFLKQAGRRELVFGFITNHDGPPYLMLIIPLGVRSRRDGRKAEGNSSSCPYLSVMPLPKAWHMGVEFHTIPMPHRKLPFRVAPIRFA